MGGGMLRGFPGTWVGEGRWGGEVERGKEEEAGWVMGGGAPLSPETQEQLESAFDQSSELFGHQFRY